MVLCCVSKIFFHHLHIDSVHNVVSCVFQILKIVAHDPKDSLS